MVYDFVQWWRRRGSVFFLIHNTQKNCMNTPNTYTRCFALVLDALSFRINFHFDVSSVYRSNGWCCKLSRVRGQTDHILITRNLCAWVWLVQCQCFIRSQCHSKIHWSESIEGNLPNRKFAAICQWTKGHAPFFGKIGYPNLIKKFESEIGVCVCAFFFLSSENWMNEWYE